jgi:hypothetical protein
MFLHQCKTPGEALAGPPCLTLWLPLVELASTRAGGFVLTREEAAGKWGAATASLVRTVKAAQSTGAQGLGAIGARPHATSLGLAPCLCGWGSLA